MTSMHAADDFDAERRLAARPREVGCRLGYVIRSSGVDAFDLPANLLMTSTVTIADPVTDCTGTGLADAKR
jgi:hypothetical protein